MTGNEEMHLKNYSIIFRHDKVELTPAYDFLNSSIVLGKDAEESALTLKGKKKNLNKDILIEYLGVERLNLNETVINKTLGELKNALPSWFNLLTDSFLGNNLKEQYIGLLEERIHLLQL